MPDVRVRRLHLTGPRARLVRAQTVIEDALHTASLPLGRPGWLLVVRRLDLGIVDPDRPSQSLAPRIERLVRELVHRAVPAGAPEAGDAPAVWFRDELVARVRLVERVLRGPAPVEWYWPAAVPGWRAEAPRTRLEHLLETPTPAPSSRTLPPLQRTAAFVVELARAGLLAEVYTLVGTHGRWCAPLAAVAVPEMAPRAVSAPLGGVVRAVEARWGPASPEARLIRAALRVMEHPIPPRRPVPAVDAPAPGVRATELPVVVEAPAAAPYAPPLPTFAGAPGRAQPVAPLEVPRAVAAVLDAPAAPIVARVQGTPPAAPLPVVPRRTEAPDPHVEQAPVAAPAVESPVAAWLAGARVDPLRGRLRLPDLDGARLRTAWGGLFFTLPLLVERGLPDGLVEGADPSFAWWVLGAVIEAMGPDPEDGALLLVSRLVSEERPDADVLDAWVAGLAATWERRAGEPLHTLVAARALLVATPTHLDVLLDHGALRIAVRRRALDTDPGWVWWLGRIITFHYVETADFEALWQVDSASG